jgi:hypothetical protein
MITPLIGGLFIDHKNGYHFIRNILLLVSFFFMTSEVCYTKYSKVLFIFVQIILKIW